MTTFFPDNAPLYFLPDVSGVRYARLKGCPNNILEEARRNGYMIVLFPPDTWKLVYRYDSPV